MLAPLFRNHACDDVWHIGGEGLFMAILKCTWRGKSWSYRMAHDISLGRRFPIHPLLKQLLFLALISGGGCSRPLNEESSPPLPPSVTAHASSISPAPEPKSKRYPPPVLTDQSIGVVVDDKSVSMLCRRDTMETIRYECRIPKQPVPENVGFPSGADQLLISLGRVNDQGNYVSVSTVRSKLKRTPQGTHQAIVQLKVPPKPPNRPAATTGWTLQVKAMRVKTGYIPHLVFEQPVSLE